MEQFARYAIVGFSNVAIDVGLLTLFVHATGISTGPYVGVFASVASSFAVVNSYVWNCRWTFERRLDPSRQFIPFAVVQVVSIAITGFLVAGITQALVTQDLVPFLRVYEAKAVAIAASAAWNFSALRYYVFRKQPA